MNNQIKAVAAQMNMSDIQAQIRKYIDLANAHYNRNIPIPTVDFSVRGVVAGQAFYSRHHIALNATLLRENPEVMMNQTVPHEVAHLAIRHVYGADGVKPHGREWKKLMVVLGAKPKTSHSYDVTNARQWKQRLFSYMCGCQEHKLTTTRHNKIIRTARFSDRPLYTCRKCRQALVLKGSPKSKLAMGLLSDVRAAAEKLETLKNTTAKSWNPKAGSKGALALDIYKDILWMADDQIVKYLMKKMSIKLANARAYLAKCKTA